MVLTDISGVEAIFDSDRYKDNMRLMLFDSMCIFEWLMLDEQTQICGFSLVEDLSQYGISMIWRLKNNPQLIELEKAKTEMMQDSLPLRWGNMFILDIPWYFNIIWRLVRPFMKKKLTDRLVFMSMKHIDKVYEADYDRSFLPPHFGGTLQYDFGEEFLRLRIQEEGHEYVPGGAKGCAGESWIHAGGGSGGGVCTPEELAGFRELLGRGLEVFKKDRHGRRQKRVLYSADRGETLCFADHVGGAKAGKVFSVAEISDVREMRKGKGKEDGFQIVHPQRTLEVTVGSPEARDLMIKRIRGLVLEAALESNSDNSDGGGGAAAETSNGGQ
jgi:hypothetical protein